MNNNNLVTTINGEKIPREKTRYIDGNYYKIGDRKIKDSGDCYKVDGKYRRASTGYIIYDHRTKQYEVFNSNNFVKNQVIGFKGKDPILGDFSINDNYEPVQIDINGKIYYVVDENILKNNRYYSEDLQSGIYKDRKKIDAYRFVIPSPCSSTYKNSLQYDSRQILYRAKEKFNKYKKDNKNISKNIKTLSKSLRGLSFGVEFETTKGFIPERICNKNGLIPLRDGSVGGIEYVTIPHSGEHGIQALLDSLRELKKRTEYDESCSLHFHIGNIPRTEEFFLALFKVLCFTQNKMFELFPIYKKYNFGFKRKHYTKPFPFNETIFLMDRKIDSSNIKENFNILFEFLSMGIPYHNYNNDLSNVEYHPSDPEGRSKWLIRSRYHYINLIPLLFGNKQTVEFRIHTPTYDESKIINFLLLCSTIINYTIKRQSNILNDSKFLRNINLHDIIYDLNYPSILNDGLSDYIAKRRDFVYNMNKKENNFFSESQFKYINHYINWEKEALDPNDQDYKTEGVNTMNTSMGGSYFSSHG